MQFMTMDQLPDLRVYELALEGGRPVLGVRIGDAERRRAATEVIRRHRRALRQSIRRLGDRGDRALAGRDAGAPPVHAALTGRIIAVP